MTRRLAAVCFACILLSAAAFSASAKKAAAPFTFHTPVTQCEIRDPYVLVHDRLYYMYGTIAAIKRGFGCYVSADLKSWDGPFSVWTVGEASDAAGDFWAPV